MGLVRKARAGSHLRGPRFAVEGDRIRCLWGKVSVGRVGLVHQKLDRVVPISNSTFFLFLLPPPSSPSLFLLLHCACSCNTKKKLKNNECICVPLIVFFSASILSFLGRVGICCNNWSSSAQLAFCFPGMPSRRRATSIHTRQGVEW